MLLRKFAPLLFLFVLAAPNVARAGDNAAAAEALFVEAKQLTADGNYDEACPKFLASYKLDRTLGTLLNLADCHEHVGRIATSWAEWGEAIEMARRMGDDRVEFATKRRDALTSRLPKLTVKIDDPVDGLDVYRDDTKVEPGAYNLPLPVDPGEHTVSVRRGKDVLEQKKAEATEGAASTVDFDLSAIAAKHPAPQAPKPGTVAVESPTRDRPPPSSSQKTIGWVVGGVGVAALATGAGFGIAAIVKKNAANEPDSCVNNYCSPQGVDDADTAKSYANIGQWVGIGGVVLTAVGATLLLTAPSSDQRASTRSVVASPWLGPAGGGFAVSGSL